MKIGVVGAGQVGATAAYAMMLRGVGSEIVLVDKNEALAQAQAEDISHAAPTSNPLVVRSGPYEALDGARLVVISAGVNQKPGESRLDLLQRNAAVFEEVIAQVMRVAPDAILLIATNPVDVMTHLAQRVSGLPEGRVIGSGTILDTARFRMLLGQHFDISPKSIHAYVLGEHGDSEVLWWSGATVGSVSMNEYAAQARCPITAEVRQRIDEGVRGAAGRIIRAKGATWFGIGGGLARIAQAIQNDERAILSASILEEVDGDRVTLSLPRVVGAAGVVGTVAPLLDAEEKLKFRRSADILKRAADELLAARQV